MSVEARPLQRGSRQEEIFPTLTAGQIDRIAAQARKRGVEPGEMLVDVGDGTPSFFVVLDGAIDIMQPCTGGDMPIVRHGPGGFTGESNMLSGRPSMLQARAAEPGSVLELSRDQLLAVIQNDTELSDIFMRAFLLRRLELVASEISDVVILGSRHSPDSLRVRDFLSRNGHPYAYVDLERDDEFEGLLHRFAVAVDDIPIVIANGGSTVLRNPDNRRVAEALGFNASVDIERPRDVVIVGGGPAGIAAAVYAASEGLDTLVIEASAPGGQAAASTRIENYLGFPTGISGQELADRGYAQARKFGADFLVASGAISLDCERRPYRVRVGDGMAIASRTVVIATGAHYRRPALPDLERLIGAGIYFGATPMEAQLCSGEEAIVIGGANSAGQAAVFLSQAARRVYMLVRAAGLANTMSRYLVRRIEDHPAIELRTDTEIDGIDGGAHLESVRWRHRPTGRTDSRAIRHLFVMTGADPNTEWLNGCVALDANGFIRTGHDLGLVNGDSAAARPPYLLETSLPGVFAVGDVRSGSLKRVAAAVGEGSAAVAYIHRVLAE